MKILIKTLTITLCLIGYGNSASAQCSNTINTTSTDWRDYPSTSSNNWDWTQSGSIHPIYLQANQSSASAFIELPYFCTRPPGSGSCPGFHNVIEYQFKGAGKEHQDIHPEDGWELLMKDFGTPNTVGSTSGGTGRPNPYFMLYNKYTGRLKIYVALMGVHNQQAAFIRLGFDTKDPGTQKKNTNETTRALFNAAEPIQKTVLEFKPVLEYKQMNQVNNYQDALDYQWTVCELTTSYDPCTCENTPDNLSKISTLRMQLMKVGTVNIEATIDGKATQESVASGSGASSTTNGSLASFFKPLTDAGSAAQTGKKSWADTKSTVENIVDGGNTAMTYALAREWLKKDDPYWDDVDVQTKIASIKQVFAAPDSMKKLLGVRQAKNTKLGKILESSKGIASALPYVGMAIGIIDFMVDGGEENKGEEKAGPVTFDINLSLKGTLTEVQALEEVSFFTPGSPIPSATGDHLTPIYNNVLGVLSILELPDLEYAELTPSVSMSSIKEQIGICWDNTYIFNNFEDAANIRLRQFRPKSNVKYVLNPASELEVQSIDAAIVLEYSNQQELFIGNTKVDKTAEGVAIPYFAGMASKYISAKQLVKSITNSSSLNLEYVSANYPDEDASFIRLRTGYVPITCFSESQFMLVGSDNYGKAYLKLYIKLKNKNNSNAEPVTMVMTYDWTQKFHSATKNTSVSGTFDAKVDGSTEQSNYAGICKTEYSNFHFDDFNISNTPFGQNGLYSKKGSYISDWYTYANEQFLTVNDRLIIRSGAVIPVNAIIKSAGVIAIERNVTFGDNVKISSAVKINLGVPNKIEPTLELKILNSSRKCNP